MLRWTLMLRKLFASITPPCTEMHESGLFSG